MVKRTIIGDIYKTNNYGECQIIELTSTTHCRVKFLQTGYEKIVERGELKRGRVRDPFYPIYYGVGFTGSEISYKDKEYIKIRKLWESMLRRCYYKENDMYKYYGEKGVIVDNRWFNLENFREDIKELENYNKWIDKKDAYSWTLDKDKYSKDVKLYSKDTCWFTTMSNQVLLQNKVKIIGYVNGEKKLEFSNIKHIEDTMGISSPRVCGSLSKRDKSAGKLDGVPIAWRYEDEIL